MDFTAKRDAIYDWVSRILIIPVIWNNQDGNQPKRPYATIHISGLTKENHDFIQSPEDGEEAKVLGEREFTLEIEYFGHNPIGVLADLQIAIEHPAGRQELTDAGIVYVDDLDITETTELQESHWDERATYEILLRTAVQVDSPTGQIDTVNAEGDYKNESNETIYAPQLTIPPTS